MTEKLTERTLLKFIDEDKEMVKILDGTLNLEIGNKVGFYSKNKGSRIREGFYEIIKRDPNWIDFSFIEHEYSEEPSNFNRYYSLKRIGSLSGMDIRELKK